MNESGNVAAENNDYNLTRHRHGKEVCMVLSALSSILNAVFLIVLARNRKLFKRRQITYHIANLAFADYMVGLSTACFFVIEIKKESSKDPFGHVLFVIIWSTELVSFSATCLMAIERVAVVTKPLTWTEIFTTKRIIIVIAGIWITAFTLAFLVFFYKREMRLVLSLFFLFPVCFTSAAYGYIYNKLAVNLKHTLHGKSLVLQQKTSSLVLTLVLVLIVTVLPYMLCIQILMICKWFLAECNISQLAIKISDYLYAVELLNFVANPVIYIWSVKVYRRAFWATFLTNRCR